MLPPIVRRWTLLLQHRADRRRLLDMDDHHLKDLGLRRGDLEHGMSLQRSSLPDLNTFCRRGALIARGWTLKLYIPPSATEALRPEDEAVAGRAVAAMLAEPGTVHGFAILRRSELPGMLRLTSWWWDGACLIDSVLDVPGTTPCRRVPRTGLDVGVIGLIARECAAWRRHVLDARRPDYAAYLREDCA